MVGLKINICSKLCCGKPCKEPDFRRNLVHTSKNVSRLKHRLVFLKIPVGSKKDGFQIDSGKKRLKSLSKSADVDGEGPTR